LFEEQRLEVGAIYAICNILKITIDITPKWRIIILMVEMFLTTAPRESGAGEIK
jgi:hypothetical protein